MFLETVDRARIWRRDTEPPLAKVIGSTSTILRVGIETTEDNRWCDSSCTRSKWSRMNSAFLFSPTNGEKIWAGIFVVFEILSLWVRESSWSFRANECNFGGKSRSPREMCWALGTVRDRLSRSQGCSRLYPVWQVRHTDSEPRERFSWTDSCKSAASSASESPKKDRDRETTSEMKKNERGQRE